MKRRTLLLIALTLLSTAAFAQLGFPPFGSFQDGGFDSINRQNLNVVFSIPIVSVPGRGQDFTYALIHNSLVWQRNGNYWSPAPGNGWTVFKPETFKTTGAVSYRRIRFFCDHPTQPEYVWYYYNYTFTDEAGTKYAFPVEFYERATACMFEPTGPRTGYASGYYLNATSPTFPKVTAPNGIEVVVSSTKDRNGNYFSKIIVSSSETHWKDTLGRIALKVINRTNCLSGEVTYPSCTDHVYRAPDGTERTVTTYNQTFSIKTNFGCSGVVEYTGSWSLPKKIGLPNGQSYVFDYESTPSFPSYYTGRVKKVTLPTGGSYEYIYPTDQNNGIVCSDGTAKRLTRKITEGTTTSTWEYSRVQNGNAWDLTVGNPVGDETVYTFVGSGQTSMKVYQGSATSGTLLRTVNTTWSGGKPSSTTVILADTGQQSKTDTTFDSFNNLTQLIEYDWGPGAPGSPIRTTQITYVSTSPYTSRNMRNLPEEVLVREGGAGGTIKSRTVIAYDQSGYINVSCPPGVPQHDDASYGCTFTVRGSPTTVTTYENATAQTGAVARHSYYDFFGNVTKADVNCCQQKEWIFSATTQYGYPDQVKSGPSGNQLVSSMTYHFDTGLVTSITNENNKTTSFAYDFFKRLTSVTRPDSAQMTYGYDDTNRIVTAESPVQGTDRIRQKTYFDQLGRSIKTETSDASGGDCSSTETRYDSLGRDYKQYNPAACGSTSTYWTETQFDALGRVQTVLAQDGSQTVYSYSGVAITVTDPTGKQRKSESDALGRLNKLWEPDPNNNNLLTLETSYLYNVLDLLTQVNQGVQQRSYQYDDLGRLTQQTTPEAGQWNYSYLNASGSACSSNPLLVCRRTDARGVVTIYGYDPLNRLTQVSYDVGSTGVPPTATVTYAYGTDPNVNENGRLKTVTDGVGSEAMLYDVLGRVTRMDKIISGTTYTTSYEYNLGSQVKKITYPSGRAVEQSYNAIGRVIQIYSGSTQYLNNFSYDQASGLVTGFKYGNNAVEATFGYAPDRLQPTSLAYKKVGDANPFFSLTYCYWQNCDTQSGGNNGQINRITDSVDSGRTVNYTYDALHRLKTALTNGSATYPQWGLSWTYDRYGNRTAQSVTAGSGPSNSVTIDPYTNRITGTGYGYDANGNMTADGLNSLVYDAESRVVTLNSGATEYLYDGAGLRVKKCAPNCTSPTTRTVYIFSGSKVIAEYDNGAAVGSPTREYIYSGSQLIATHEGGSLKFQMSDHLSARVITDASGTVVGQQGHYPYGESWYSASGTKWRFTSYERDAESGNDYAIFRVHIPRLGRFDRPDPIAGSITDPQSLNRYLYARNDPANLIDPLGLFVSGSDATQHMLYPLGTPGGLRFFLPIVSCQTIRQGTGSGYEGDAALWSQMLCRVDFWFVGPRQNPDPSSQRGRKSAKEEKKARLAECKTPEGTAKVWEQLAQVGLKEAGLDQFVATINAEAGDPKAKVEFTTDITKKIPQSVTEVPEGSYRFDPSPSMNLKVSADGLGGTVEFDRFKAGWKNPIGSFLHGFLEVLPHKLFGTGTNPCKIREKLISQGRMTP